jgi:Putative restriction endonuclease
MSRTATSVGPHDHGRRMGLEEFDAAEGREGKLYELGRGIIAVVDVPKGRHLAQIRAIKNQLYGFSVAHAGIIDTIATGSECKLLITALQSERHPDLAIPKDPMPAEEDFWHLWIPAIVIEVVSPGSEFRDYVEKRAEYLLFGVREYWIVDADKQEMLVLRRSGARWTERILRPQQVYRTRLLPGLEFACGPVFEAANTRRA